MKPSVAVMQGDASVYSAGWFFDIARGLYTLETGEVASKSAAMQWVLKKGYAPRPEILEKALELRRNPHLLIRNDMSGWLSSLGPAVQELADMLESKLAEMKDSSETLYTT